MAFPYYSGQGHRPTEPIQLPQPHSERLHDPNNYRPDAGLVDACNVALLLGQPLLLTGEPGTGKTQFAYSLAQELGLTKPLKFETKSTSVAQDLLYSYDALRRFQDAQSKAATHNNQDALPYIRYNALGQAIIRSRPPAEVAHILPPNFDHEHEMRSVVLIDEVDKAPRDLPNDILNELELLYFRIPELDNSLIEADPNLYPVVVITSNSEKALPDAFLRRCVYYHIPFPERARLLEIIRSRLGNELPSAMLNDALDLFTQLREQSSGLRKKPSTAELLSWLLTLQQLGQGIDNPLTQPNIVLSSLSVLVKTAADQSRASEIAKLWLQNRTA